MSIFINHTNHAAGHWSPEQRMAAEHYGEIVDFPFPAVSAGAGTDEIVALARQTGQEMLRKAPAAVLCQGEYIYVYALTMFLQAHGILVLAACSERIVHTAVQEDGSTVRRSIFRFVRFRAYPCREQVIKERKILS